MFHGKFRGMHAQVEGHGDRMVQDMLCSFMLAIPMSGDGK